MLCEGASGEQARTYSASLQRAASKLCVGQGLGSMKLRNPLSSEATPHYPNPTDRHLWSATPYPPFPIHLRFPAHDIYCREQTTTKNYSVLRLLCPGTIVRYELCLSRGKVPGCSKRVYSQRHQKTSFDPARVPSLCLVLL